MAPEGTFFWVKYGFENTPLKMYNSNVSCATLLSFIRTTCTKDIVDYCKQKNIQLGIELDALRKLLSNRKGLSSATSSRTASMATARSTTSVTDSAVVSETGGVSVTSAPSSSSRPPSGASRPTTPGMARRKSNAVEFEEEELNEELKEAKAKKLANERQLEIVNAASRLTHELSSGVAWVDLLDENGKRLLLDEGESARVNTFVTARMQYTVGVVSVDANGEKRVVPLIFKLHG